MADITVDIVISLVSYKSWLVTSYISTTIVNKEGQPLISENELGPDQEDFFNSYIDEAARDLLKLFLSRQGDVTGTPFEQTATDIYYRFKEGEPVLTSSLKDAIVEALEEDVKNSLFTYVTIKWLEFKGNVNHAGLLNNKLNQFKNDILGSLYRLHD